MHATLHLRPPADAAMGSKYSKSCEQIEYFKQLDYLKSIGRLISKELRVESELDLRQIYGSKNCKLIRYI